MKTTNYFCAILMGLLLSGCGGGGGGTAVGGGFSSTLSFFVPRTTSSSQLTTGSASSLTGNVGYGESTITLPGLTYPAVTSKTVTVQILPNVHITDTGAAMQWASGWTGAGKTIAVIDDFTTNINSRLETTISREVKQTISGGGGAVSTANYDVKYVIDLPTTHGDLTANIAGGDGMLATSTQTVSLNAVSATQTSCDKPSCSAPYVVAYTYYTDDLDHRLSVSWNKAAGVAKEAIVVRNQVTLGSTSDPQAQLNSIVAHMQNSSSMSVINLSLGNSMPNGTTLDVLKAAITSNPLTNSYDSVIVISAGNSGAACTSANLGQCNALAGALALLDTTNKNTIVVGATTGSGSTETIASYSNRAGIFAERYLLAPGGTGFKYYSGDEIVGTSFAAPRVAGAAALLRQKYPNLNGSQAASILLLTANKDINNDGIDDFSGISQTYGQGKLNLNRAMSPVGSLSIK
jgi:subtilisin family serine protease